MLETLCEWSGFWLFTVFKQLEQSKEWFRAVLLDYLACGFIQVSIMLYLVHCSICGNTILRATLIHWLSERNLHQKVGCIPWCGVFHTFVTCWRWFQVFVSVISYLAFDTTWSGRRGLLQCFLFLREENCRRTIIVQDYVGNRPIPHARLWWWLILCPLGGSIHD